LSRRSGTNITSLVIKLRIIPAHFYTRRLLRA
jgi:hypothetical protein